MATNKISTINQVLFIVNIIAFLFFIFSDTIITSIKWSDEGIGIGDIATILSAMIMGFTAWIMYKGNKISAESVQEMKSQRELEYTKIELTDLKSFINENILVHINEANNMIDKNITPVDRSIFDNGNDKIYSALLCMGGLSNDTFYEKDFKEIWDQLVPLYSMIQCPKEYSSTIVIGIYQILTRVGSDLYKALNHKPTHTELLECIKSFKDMIQNSMTPSDQQAFIKHQEQFNHLINHIKTTREQS